LTPGAAEVSLDRRPRSHPLPRVRVFGAVAGQEGGDALGRQGPQFAGAVRVGAGLQGESVEWGGDHQPGQLFGGEVGVVDAQQAAGGEDAQGVREHAQVAGPAAGDVVRRDVGEPLRLQDARLNTVMKRLTAWAAIIAVPTAVTGYFGQNIPYPGFGDQWGFALSAASIIIASALYLLFRRKDWL
jgi:hypothetical protein